MSKSDNFFKFLFLHKFFFGIPNSKPKFKMPKQMATCLSHACIAGTGIYCLARLNSFSGSDWYLKMPVFSYGIVATHSLVGIYYWGTDNGSDVAKIYNATKIMRDMFAFPCIVGQLYLNYGYKREFAYVHPLISIIPFALYAADKDYEQTMEAVLFGNLISCGVASFFKENFWGIGAAVSYLITLGIIKNGEKMFDIETQDLHNFAFCFYNIFSLFALNGKPI